MRGDSVALERAKKRLSNKEKALVGIQQHLEQIAPYVLCSWEECPQWVRKIMAMCGYNNTKEWYNIVLRRALVTIQQCQRIKKSIRNYGKAKETSYKRKKAQG